ncbi:uncharacterized protein B0H18DRAFT_1150644 [Fomitopsis serialis]|uniref:uncharacterized protein n=1 Tax=Fomitopsis serialis TaxID=139415 RepID=UPI002007C48B|nr:uncharacterized protein B0H18DRAFT_1150644 [Neoantrodia serialis]KAH9937122.1 hypothetical protein B0H18DRAFT_1150644 [Neoantrodia serialis]
MYIQPQPVANYSFPCAPASAPSASDTVYHHTVPLTHLTLISPISPISHAASDSAPAPPLPESETGSPTSSRPDVPSGPAPDSPSTAAPAPVTAEQSPLEYYGNATQVMFPTPSELLSELSARDVAGTAGESSRKTSVSGPSSPSEAKMPSVPVKPRKGKNDGDAAVPQSKPPPETLRKAYFRRVAEAVGFPPTDPDTITSHDKKRSYLECLEQYAQWLHEQIRLVGHEPLPLERVQQYRGPSSRSIRTLLVHMQDEVRELHQQTLEDEREYVNLQTQVQMQHASAAAHQLRRHSVAACGFPDASMSSAPFLQPYPIHSGSATQAHHVQGPYQHY